LETHKRGSGGIKGLGKVDKHTSTFKPFEPPDPEDIVQLTGMLYRKKTGEVSAVTLNVKAGDIEAAFPSAVED
jgi:hypothetical protein